MRATMRWKGAGIMWTEMVPLYLTNRDEHTKDHSAYLCVSVAKCSLNERYAVQWFSTQTFILLDCWARKIALLFSLLNISAVRAFTLPFVSLALTTYSSSFQLILCSIKRKFPQRMCYNIYASYTYLCAVHCAGVYSAYAALYSSVKPKLMKININKKKKHTKTSHLKT